MPRNADHSREVLDAIRLIVRDVRIQSRASERHGGLGAAQLFVLSKLAESPASSVNELADRTLTHQSSVSVVVSKLERRGFVKRDASAKDGRRQELSLSPRGRTLLRKAPRAPADRIVDALATLPKRHVAQLARHLHSLLRAMDIQSTDRAPLFDDEKAST